MAPEPKICYVGMVLQKEVVDWHEGLPKPTGVWVSGGTGLKPLTEAMSRVYHFGV